eukprot:scaffold6990_cov403-Prasinococcus_capsulatus_cf.AAC.1
MCTGPCCTTSLSIVARSRAGNATPSAGQAMQDCVHVERMITRLGRLHVREWRDDRGLQSRSLGTARCIYKHRTCDQDLALKDR